MFSTDAGMYRHEASGMRHEAQSGTGTGTGTGTSQPACIMPSLSPTVTGSPNRIGYQHPTPSAGCRSPLKERPETRTPNHCNILEGEGSGSCFPCCLSSAVNAALTLVLTRSRGIVVAERVAFPSCGSGRLCPQPSMPMGRCLPFPPTIERYGVTWVRAWAAASISYIETGQCRVWGPAACVCVVDSELWHLSRYLA